MTKKIKITDFLATCGMTLQRIKCVNSLITECQKKLLDSLFSTECPSVPCDSLVGFGRLEVSFYCENVILCENVKNSIFPIKSQM